MTRKPLPRPVSGILILSVAAALVATGCAGARPTVASPSVPGPGAVAPLNNAPAEMTRLYRTMGLVAGAGAIPFTASVSFLRAPSPDSTLTLVALSLPSRALGFAREGDRYAAAYVARIQLRQGPTVVRTIEVTEQVRVPTFRETSRTDESIIWQQFLRLAPGRYTMTVSVKDESSIRNSSEEVSVDVPRLAPDGLTTAVPVYEAIPRLLVDSLPRLLARPRSTVVYGTDSLLALYVDAVGATPPAAVRVRVLGDADIVGIDTLVELPQRGASRSTTVGIPVGRLPVGINTVQITAVGRTDTARTRVLVTLGEDVPIGTFDEMLTYLRLFVPQDQLKELRDSDLGDRAAAWTSFLKATDPVPGTAEHEGLRDYFARIRTANLRFRDDAGAGWQSDRGTAFVALGDPDNIIDTGLLNPNERVRQQIWEYRELRIQLVFVDQTGFGRWRLAPQSRGDLDVAIRRKLQR
jgi:GWxTD domain-containing protein